MEPGRAGLRGREVPGLILGDSVEHGVPLALVHGVRRGGNNITSSTIIATRTKLPLPPNRLRERHSAPATSRYSLLCANETPWPRLLELVYATPTSGARWL